MNIEDFKIMRISIRDREVIYLFKKIVEREKRYRDENWILRNL